MEKPITEEPTGHFAEAQLDLLRRARHAPDSIALDFMLVNESYLLADYRQAGLWLRDRGTSVLSGVAWFASDWRR